MRLSPQHVVRRSLSLVTHSIRALPVVVLMPHSRCNCRCVMCDIWKGNHNRQELSRQDLEPHLEAFHRLGVRQVVLSGGEALMHSNLWTLCELLREAQIRITLLSTGLLLERHAGDVVQWVDDVIVSLDGSPAVHDAIRNVPRAYDRLAQGVFALRERAPRYRITARSVLQRRNYFDLVNLIEAARELALDQLSFLAADVSSQAFNRSIPWDAPRVSEVALTPAEAQTFAGLVEEILVRYRSEFESGFIAESPRRMRELAQDMMALSGNGDLAPRKCNAPWVSTVIEADGTVRPCFFHPSLGNLREASLEAIVNSEEAISFRRRLNVRTDSVCRRCVCTLHLAPWVTA